MPVTLARKENLPSIFGVARPSIPRSSTKPLILPPCAADFAQTTRRSAMGALVIQVLAPVSAKPPSTLSARVVIAPGSEPWSGSVSPKAPTHAPVASFGRQRARSSSVP